MEKENRTLYDVLGVSPNATLKEIKLAYKKKAIECHPDNANLSKKDCHDMMCKINEAYSILRDIDSRRLYDEVLEKQESSSEQEENFEKNTKKKKEKQNDQYEYYNFVDFTEYEQEEFIEWIEYFSYDFIRKFNLKYNTLDNQLFEEIYSQFDTILNFEKMLNKKKKKYNTL